MLIIKLNPDKEVIFQFFFSGMQVKVRKNISFCTFVFRCAVKFKSFYLESKLIFQDLCQKIAMSVHFVSIPAGVGCHNSANSSGDTVYIWCQVDIEHFIMRCYCISFVCTILSCPITYEMLCRCHDIISEIKKLVSTFLYLRKQVCRSSINERQIEEDKRCRTLNKVIYEVHVILGYHKYLVTKVIYGQHHYTKTDQTSILYLLGF